MERVLTGDRPTGKLHLGHYIGSLRNRVKLQQDYDCFVLIADIQALTTHWDEQEMLAEHVREVAMDYLAVGIDPEDTTICLQSRIPELHELTMYLGMLASVHQLFHNPTLKHEAEQMGMAFSEKATGEEDRVLNYGFLGYPVSQTADIVIFKAKHVPVGKDQLPHIEFARKLVRKFNNLYGDGEEILVEPEAMIGGTGSRAHPVERWLWSYRPPESEVSLPEFFKNYAELPPRSTDLWLDDDEEGPGEETVEEMLRGLEKLWERHPLEDSNMEGSKLDKARDELHRLLENGQSDRAVLKGIQGEDKMSKSLGNVINLSDDYDDIWDVVESGRTDPDRIHLDDEGNPDVCNVYSYHQLFNKDEEPTVRYECRHGLRGCVDCKKELAESIDDLIEPFRERRSYYENNPEEVDEILHEGTRKAREVADETMREVRAAMEIDYFGREDFWD